MKENPKMNETKDLDPYKEENWDEKNICKEHKWEKFKLNI